MRCPLFPRSSVAIVALALLGGCATSQVYPSLALRPIEENSLADPATPRPSPGMPAAEADARFATLVAQARTGDAAFRQTLAEARPVLERGRTASLGSDAWGASQTELSRVVATRTPVTQALLALQADSETPETRADTGLYAAAGRALDTVSGIDRSETEALRALTPTND